ncbi:hypothetical protein ACLOJK_023230, partial [Asimina triloba]
HDHPSVSRRIMGSVADKDTDDRYSPEARVKLVARRRRHPPARSQPSAVHKPSPLVCLPPMTLQMAAMAAIHFGNGGAPLGVPMVHHGLVYLHM